MNILYVYVHPNVHSFNHELKTRALTILKSAGHKVVISDLYAMNFNPVASWQDVLANQLSADINEEITKVKQADHLIFQFPLWWFSMPAMMKGWFDRVLVKGFAYDSGKVFETGLLKGKTASLMITTQSPVEAYQKEGLHGDSIDVFLRPINHMLRFVGVEVRQSFITHGAYEMSERDQQQVFSLQETYLKNLL